MFFHGGEASALSWRRETRTYALQCIAWGGQEALAAQDAKAREAET